MGPRKIVFLIETVHCPYTSVDSIVPQCDKSYFLCLYVQYFDDRKGIQTVKCSAAAIPTNLLLD